MDFAVALSGSSRLPVPAILSTGNQSVFDFDKAVFPDLWNGGSGKKNINAYVKYYLSDHQPMWMEFNTV